jgi:hypothetical protein
VTVFIKSEATIARQAEYRARQKHRVEAISFSANIVECICGERVKAIEDGKDLISVEWQAHMRANGMDSRLTR